MNEDMKMNNTVVPVDFVHLHCHSELSRLDSPAKTIELIRKAKSLGMTAMAITEHGNMMSYYTFYKDCIAEGIKPIIGVETYVLPDLEMMNSEDKKIKETKYHFVLLAKDETGLKQLIKANTESYIYQYKSSRSVFPRMTYDLMRKHFVGGHVIALSACINGEIAELILEDKIQEAKEKAALYQDIFGKDNFYFEIQNHGMPEELKVRTVLAELSREMDIPLVATNDCHYANPGDSKRRSMTVAMRFGTNINDGNFHLDDGSLYVKSEEEMKALFPEFPEAIANTRKIADLCNVTISPSKHFPVFGVPEGYTEISYLEKLARDQIPVKYPDYNNYTPEERKRFDDRFDHEISVIGDLKYAGYLLIVQDFISEGKRLGMVGPGRGSAVGSLVCNLLGITNVDPLKYDLIFERFLNRERVSDPDIDTDFDPMHRDLVIQYVKKAYGDDCVCSIMTKGTLAARAAIRAAGRAKGINLDLCDRVAKMIPSRPGITINKVFEENPEFKSEYDGNPEVKDLVDDAILLEGMIVQTGVHAAGIIIADRPVSEYVPLMYDQKQDIWITQLDKDECEQMGLLKMDFLGLENLNIILRTLADIKKNHGIELNINDIPHDDENVIREIFAKGKTKAVFQFESAGMVSLLKKFQPQSLEDLILLNAAYRPGPLQYLDEIINVRHGRKKPEYIVPQMKEILEVTYGKPIYQEQIMQIFNKVAGFSLGEADIIRRAMSKKKMKELNKYLPRFKDNLMKVGASLEDTESFCDQLMDFAHYAFNKSHAAAYAVVANITAWLKYYYPVEYMANVLNSANPKKLPVFLKECKNMGIPVLTPSVNESGKLFTPTKNGAIRFGLAGIKNVGKACDYIIEERKNGSFSNILTFIQRMYKTCNKTVIASLIKAGCFDGMQYNRNQMHSGFNEYKEAYKDMVEKLENPRSRETTKQKAVDKVNVFRFDELAEMPKEELLKNEMELIGYYASGHPLDPYEKIIDEKASVMIGDIDDDSEDMNDMEVTVVGMINDFKKLYRKADKSEMGSFVIEDLTGEIKCICFTRSYARNKEHIQKNALVKVRGRISIDTERDDEGNIVQSEIQIIVDDVSPLETKKSVFLFVKSENDLPKVKHILEGFPGTSEVNIMVKGKPFIKAEQKVKISDSLKMVCMCELGVKSFSARIAS